MAAHSCNTVNTYFSFFTYIVAESHKFFISTDHALDVSGGVLVGNLEFISI